jgi:hypothetical protein
MTNKDQLKELSTPPKPPLAFRVGVVGHRPDRLEKADLVRLGDVIRQILLTIQEQVSAFAKANKALFTPEAPVLRAISPLAEGADRIFGEQAIDLHWNLCCVMPFHQEEFEKDFLPGTALEPDSLARFHALLDKAGELKGSTSFQINGSRDHEAAAYGFCGRVVLNQSDILIAVWDGERPGKLGGTTETLDAARRQGIPVIWIDARAPHAWQRMDSNTRLPDDTETRAVPDGSGTPDIIRNLVWELLELPDPHIPDGHKSAFSRRPERTRPSLENYYAQKKPRMTRAVFWKAFQSIVGDSSFPRINFRIGPFEQAVLDDWPMDQSTPVAAMVDRLRPFYAWPDKLSVLYSDRYRSAFILVFLLAAFAVAMALTPMLLQLHLDLVRGRIYSILELGSIGIIFLIVLCGRVGKWHERWIDCRLAAELIRHLRVVAPVGCERPFPQALAHHATYGNPSSTWMNWYARAVTRAVGLPDVRLSREFLMKNLTHVEDLLVDQMKFHATNARRCQAIEHRLHMGILILLILTSISCVLHLLHVLLLGNVSTFFCGFFPALGAALAGINNQGEFRRVTKRSEAMQEQIKAKIENIAILRKGEVTAWELSFFTSDSARLLVNEVLDWRVVFLDRPLEVGP